MKIGLDLFMSKFTPFSLQDVNYNVRSNHSIDNQSSYRLSLDYDILNMYNTNQRTYTSEEILRCVVITTPSYYIASSPLRETSLQFTVNP